MAAQIESVVLLLVCFMIPVSLIFSASDVLFPDVAALLRLLFLTPRLLLVALRLLLMFG